MVSATVLRIFNLVCYGGFLALLILGPLGTFGGVTTAQVSAAYPTPLTPAPYTFGIWFLIMGSLGVFCIYQFWLDEDKLKRVGFFLGIALLCSGFWMLAWSYKIFWLTVTLAVAAVIMLKLVRVYGAYGYPLRKFAQARVAWAFFCCGFTCIWDEGGAYAPICENKNAKGKKKEVRDYESRSGAVIFAELFFFEMPLAVYTAWSVVAAVLTIFVAAEADGNPVSQAVGVLLAIFIVALALLDLVLASNMFYALTTIWAAIGVCVEQIGTYAVPATVIVSIAILGVFTLMVILLRFVYYLMRDSLHSRTLSSVNVR